MNRNELGKNAKAREIAFIKDCGDNGSAVLCNDEITDVQHDLEQFGYIEGEDTVLETPGILLNYSAVRYRLTTKGKEIYESIRN